MKSEDPDKKNPWIKKPLLRFIQTWPDLSEWIMVGLAKMFSLW